MDVTEDNILWYAVLKRFLPQNDELFYGGHLL